MKALEKSGMVNVAVNKTYEVGMLLRPFSITWQEH